MLNFLNLPQEMREKEYEYKKLEYTFYLNNDTNIKTDSTRTSLGRTKNSLFMSNTNTKQAYIFNTSDIIQERIKTK